MTITTNAGAWGSTPDRTRTYNLRIRSPLLYPIELQVHVIIISELGK